jgi:hypothetical protein
MRRRLTIFGVALALVLAPAALAATPTQRGYGGSAGEVQQQVEREQGGTLPFTGLDLGLMAGGGVLLIVLGTGLWRVTRHRA